MDKELYDLTNPQKSIWLTEQFHKDTNINNVCGVYLTSTSLNYDLFEKAIRLFINHHDSYQIRLTLSNGHIKQYFDNDTNFPIETVCINSEQDLLDLQEKENTHGFDLLNKRLFKITIFKFPDGHGGFIINASHIISDSWTSGIFANEVSKIYNKLKMGKDIQNDISFSYKEYILTEKQYKNSEKFKKDKAYWDNTFMEIPETASIPTSKTYPTTAISHKANRFIKNIDATTLNKLKAYCSKNKISLYNLFISIYGFYLGNVSHLKQFVMGTPILNRTNFKEKQTTGMFINVLPLKFDLHYEDSFSEFVSQVSIKATGLLRHQRYSYNYILEDLRKKDSSLPSLYNVLFSYQITKMNETNDDLPHKTSWIFNHTILNDLEIHVFEWNDSNTLQIAYDYKTQKYDVQEISDMHDRILHIINQVISDDHTLLKDITIVTEKERKTLENFNKTFVEYPKNKTIVKLFEEQVEKTPNHIALIFEDQTLTYKELNQKANSLAHYLKEKEHIQRNDFVGIMVNRSMEMIIAILATLKAGGAYIPIDPTYPDDRIQYMLTLSNAKVLLTQKKLENTVSFSHKICIDLNQNSLYDSTNTNLKSTSMPEDLAYVIFTSGSTGKPKGVMLKHKALSNLTNYCNHYIDYLKNPSYETIVSITTVSFDIFIFETLISLQKGLKLVIANEKEQTNPYSLNALLEKHNVTIIQSTPSRMQLFVNHIKDMPSIRNLKYITLAGEQLPLNLVKTLYNLTKADIYNGYGPSETTVFSTLTKIHTDKITIGKPLDNTQIYILDEHLNYIPIGMAGELYISGDGVGKGYLNHPELTKKSFIKNPFLSNSIMYKTGDIGMYQPDGTILCLGRADHQVKIRGLRIELGEIEDRIKEIPFIASCVVVKKVNEEAHEFLCAYYTANSTVTSSDIRKHIEKFLPKYMVPQYFIQMDTLPYTPNGKIDRKKLPEPQVEIIRKEIILPRNEIDRRLIDLLKNLFHTSSISLNDSFFELGGDSLHAIHLSMQIQDTFHVSLGSREILETPIIQDLSDKISKKTTTIPKAITPVPKKEFYHISSAQKRIYFASQVAGNDSVLYNVPAGILIKGDIDAKQLEHCFRLLIDRHESLRTYFTLHNDTVVQQIVDQVPFTLEVETDVNFNDLQNIFKTFIKPFSLETAPLFRAKLLKGTNGTSAILVDMHHIIADGASLSILADELTQLYNGKNLENLTITYKDFASYENKQSKTSTFKDAEHYWLHQFDGEIPVLNLPTTYSRPVIQSFEGKKVYASISSELKNKIDQLAKELDVTPYMILLSSYYILLAKYTSAEDIVVGSPIASRDILETQNIIGMFVNTLALRCHVNNQLSFKDFVLSVKKNMLDAYTYQTYPFDELVNKLHIKRDTSRNPLFDTMFIYQNNHYPTIHFHDASATYFVPDAGISKFDLSLEALPIDNEIKLSFEYATKLFSETFIQNLSNHYIHIIETVLEDCTMNIENICLLSEEETNQLLFDFNYTEVPYDKNKTITQLFEEQVEKTPDNIAVAFENETLTFKQLNEKANSLAHFLREEKHIHRNSLVGIMVNRSLEVIIGILATLKAGGAYIPIDPTYPKDRIDYMLNSSQATILLTQKHLENKVDFKDKICIDLKNYALYHFSTQNLTSINEAEDLIYCIFTSGSTGLPKGVMIPHRVITNFTNYCNHYVDYLKHPNHDTIISITTISFDLFVYEALISLQKGLKLVISNENEQTTPQLLNQLIEKHEATIIQSTPSIMQIFVNNIDNMPALKKLNYIILAGEPLPLSLVQTLHALHIIVYNGYGPSETHYCTLTKMNDDKVTIGKPIDNSQIYILDKTFHPVPIGVTGDIYIAGDCVGKGYLNNPDLTNKSFLPDPFIPQHKMYKSGDLGMYLEDGNILCLGRSDHQVKIRGLRIELEEIESLMLKYPNIHKVTVVKQVIQNREFISAYFVASKRITINALRKYLGQSLPRYMIPSYYIPLDDLPYTPNGKIDKKALPLPTEIFNISKEAYVAPKTKIEKQLVISFEKILNTKPIGINDNFFELGGDSLLAMNLNIDIQKLSNKITYQDIFRFPTVAELAQIITSNDKKMMFHKVQNLSDNFTHILKKTQKNEKLKKWSPKNILLTGSTGFLGIHILEELLKLEDVNIYCVIREEPGVTAITKLHQKLTYYFGEKYNHLLHERIFTVTGNIAKPGFGLNQEDLLQLANTIDVVIHSAANVAHYGNYNDFYNTNVVSVKYIIDFCNSFKKKLYHISTMGVAGRTLDSSYPKYKKKTKVVFDESSLYIGQDPENIYTFTKFEAEVQVLNAISQGLDAYILRMGNLMPRYRDGLFQENLSDNAFLNRLASFVNIGIIPEYMVHNQLEFTPVDSAAKAVCKLITHQTQTNRIFHLCNHRTVSVSRCLKVLRKLNHPIDILSEEAFIEKIDEILANEETKDLLKIIIDDFDENKHIQYNTEMIIKSNFTIKYLKKAFFWWPRINNRYLIRFVNILRRIL